MVKHKISDDFMEALASYENPKTLFQMATTDWEKAVAIQFVLTDKKIDKNINELVWIEWLIKGVFAVVVIELLVNILTKFI